MNKTAIFSLFLLSGTIAALVPDFRPPPPDCLLTRSGIVRADQLVSGMSYADLVRSPAYLQRRLALDPANPYRWTELGEYYMAGDRNPEAARAYTRAVELGPNTPPVLMRAANFYLIEENKDKVANLGARILRLTPEFDEIVFVDFAQMGIAWGVPAEPRPARAWMQWLLPHARPQDLLSAWAWMTSHKLADDATAADFVSEIWKRRMYWPAAEAWAAWTEPNQAGHLFNSRFSASPKPVPMDWRLGNAADFERRDGLHIHFTGKESGRISALSQIAPVKPGPYRFSAVISTTGLTTDQGPFFHIYDSEKPERLNLTTNAFLGTLPRQTASLPFIVPAGTNVITVELERRESSKFDNKIKGDLQIHEVSLNHL